MNYKLGINGELTKFAGSDVLKKQKVIVEQQPKVVNENVYPAILAGTTTALHSLLFCFKHHFFLRCLH